MEIYLTLADILLIPHAKCMQTDLDQPTKLFEYMACGIPVIASNFPEMGAIVEENNCGITVDPTNIMQISDAIIELLKDPEKEKKMGENGRRAVEEKYNWENMEKRLFGLYEELA